MNAEERAYRRECYQTAALIGMNIEGMVGAEEIKGFLARLTGELSRIRADEKREYDHLLHAAIGRARGEQC